MEEKNQTVVMTETEKAEFDAFRQAKAKKVAEEKARADREMYKQMVDRCCWVSASASRRASGR